MTLRSGSMGVVVANVVEVVGNPPKTSSNCSAYTHSHFQWCSSHPTSSTDKESVTTEVSPQICQLQEYECNDASTLQGTSPIFALVA